MVLGAPDHDPGSAPGGSTTTIESSQRGSGRVEIPVDKAAPERSRRAKAKSNPASLPYLSAKWELPRRTGPGPAESRAVNETAALSRGARSVRPGVPVDGEPVVVPLAGHVLQQ